MSGLSGFFFTRTGLNQPVGKYQCQKQFVHAAERAAISVYVTDMYRCRRKKDELRELSRLLGIMT